MASKQLKSSLLSFQERGFFDGLKINRGIERESLRVDQNGHISQKNHPKNLGSPLTNKDITTDFSEALVELVTPTFDSAEGLFSHLSDLHHFLYDCLEDEMLWNFSMPCAFNDQAEIRLAEYGNSNQGMLKHIYRKGLKLRYGSIMQSVSGIHYNFSLSEKSWTAMSGSPSQELINKNYLALIRNVKRNFWFLLSHFGASPVAHKSYLYGRDNSLEKYGAEDLFLPAATSLRMSNVGYQSPIQESLQIKYNDLDEFIDAVVKGINTPNKKFEQIGLFDAAGLPQQISSGILQIENELYDIIRPKRTGPSGDRPSTLLRQHGIEYIELRGIDINPFVPEGISENAIKLLDIFLMHSLISESPNISKDEAQEISSNNHEMVINGRSKDVTLIKNGLLCPLSEIKKAYYEELGLVAAAMDGYSSGYLTAFNSEMRLGGSLSEKIMEEMKAQNMSFIEYGLSQSQGIASTFLQTANRDFSRFIDSSKASLQELKKVEESSSMDINKYVELYNSKLKEEK